MKKHTVSIYYSFRDLIALLTPIFFLIVINVVLPPPIKKPSFFICFFIFATGYFIIYKYGKAIVQFRLINEGIKVEYLKSFPFSKKKNYILYWSQIRSFSLRKTRYSDHLIITMVNGKKYLWSADSPRLSFFYVAFKNRAAIQSKTSKKVTIRETSHFLKSLCAKIVATIILLLLFIELAFYLLKIKLPKMDTGLLLLLNYACVIYVLVVIIYHFRKKPYY